MMTNARLNRVMLLLKKGSNSSMVSATLSYLIRKLYLYLISSGRLLFWGAMIFCINFIQRAPRGTIKQFQTKRLDFIANLRSLTFSQSPVLKKNQITETLLKFNQQDKNRSYLMTTSGSSGEPFRFYIDKSLFLRRAIAISHILHSLTGRIDHRILRLSFSDMPWAPYQGLYFSPYLLDEKKQQIGEVLKKYKPNVLYGTVSHIMLFADFFKKNQIRYSFDVVLTRSEHLTVETRRRFELLFGADVYSVYASREFGPIAHECVLQNGFHVEEDALFVEIVDKDGNLLPEGIKGRILVTSFFNKSTPFIRYEIGDLGSFIPGSCCCGLNTRRLSVDGRTCDFVYFPSGRKFPVSDFFRPICFVDGIKSFQLVQPNTSELTVKIILDSSDKKQYVLNDLHNRLIVELDLSRESNFDLNIKVVEQIPLLPNGKKRLLISDVPGLSMQ